MQVTSSHQRQVNTKRAWWRFIIRVAHQADALVPYVVPALLIVLLAICVVKALYRPLWFDEIFSVWIARPPHATDIRSICATGVDLQPFPYYYVVRAGLFIFGNAELGARAPSIIGYLLFCYSAFWFVARRTSNLYGFIALLLPCITGCWYYAIEARPYALMLAFTGLAAVCWQSVSMNVSRRVALPGLGLCLAAAMALHYFSIFVLVVFGVAEIIRAIARRKIDFAVWLALAAPLLVWVPLLPVMRAAHSHAGAPGLYFAAPLWYKSLLDFAGQFFWANLMIAILATACIYFALQILEPESEIEPDGRRWFAAGEWLPDTALVIALVCVLPELEVAAGKAITHVLFARYMIPSMFGVTCLLSFTLWCAFRGGKVPALAVALAFAASFVATANIELRYANAARIQGVRTITLRKIPRFARNDSLPIAIPAVHDFLEISYYADPELSGRIWYLADNDSPWDVHGAQYAVVASAPVFNTHVIDYKTFVERNRVFYVAGSPGWLVSRWRKEGADVQLLQGGLADRSGGEADFFLRVSLPAAAR